MDLGTSGAILDTRDITHIAATIFFEQIERTEAKKTIKILYLNTFMAGKVFTPVVLKKTIIVFTHESSPIL